MAIFVLIKDWRRSALITSLLLFSFFSYGLLYQFFKQATILKGLIGHHRILLMILAGIIIGLGYLTLKKIRSLDHVTLIVNLFSIYLLIIPLINILVVDINFRSSNWSHEPVEDNVGQMDDSLKPDIYWIILDAYDRQDYLLQEFNYDNSDFIEKLRGLNFQIGDCSRSNYAHTALSLSSSFNMDYIQSLVDISKINEYEIDDLLVHSQTRRKLEELNYQIVSFSSVHWNFSDADVFYEYHPPLLTMPYLNELEVVLIRNTFLRALIDLIPSLQNQMNSWLSSPVYEHYQRQLFTLTKIEEAIHVDSPKFVFAHIETPHGPFVFDTTGSFQQENAYYRDEYFAAINHEYFVSGYVQQVRFINSRILSLIPKILSSSSQPPIIILQGDHGIVESGEYGERMNILYAVHLPGENAPKINPSISPVNTFRLIFQHYFHQAYELLPDQSYYSPRENRFDLFKVTESSPECILE